MNGVALMQPSGVPPRKRQDRRWQALGSLESDFAADAEQMNEAWLAADIEALVGSLDLAYRPMARSAIGPLERESELSEQALPQLGAVARSAQIAPRSGQHRDVMAGSFPRISVLRGYVPNAFRHH